MTAQATVYAVDDDPTILLLLEAMLGGDDVRVETYESAEHFLVAYSPNNPGCLLLDVVMPGMSGLELQRELVSRGSHIPIIFLSGASEISNAVVALKAGAIDFIQKPVKPDEVKTCVKTAMKLDMQRRYVNSLKSAIETRKLLLTRRESEVMRWLVRGKTNKEVARLLDISCRTVEVHRGRVMEKMEARNMVELVEMLSAPELEESLMYV